MLPCAWAEAGLDPRLHALNDSKQLTEAQREEYYALLTAHPDIRFAIASVAVEVIDRINTSPKALAVMQVLYEQFCVCETE